MSQYLPTREFRELNLSKRIGLLKSILRTPDNNEYGLLKEIDLEQPSTIL